MNSTQQNVGSVISLWRYPVKSMMGEELNASEVTAGGLLGDRAYALVDSSDGKIASAKNPRKWPGLFSFRAALTDVPRRDEKVPPVQIVLPDGSVVHSGQPDVHKKISDTLKRGVELRAASPELRASTVEEYWLDMEGFDHRDTVTDFVMPAGGFFDGEVLHILTTATLDRLRMSYPEGRFETRRFRPNIVVQTPPGERDFVENAWVGRTVAIGDSVRLGIKRNCFRCVMTTLPQGDLPQDPGILRTVAQHNRAATGVYASVLQSGKIYRGDSVRLE